MYRFLVLAGLITVCIVGVGFYMGYFKFNSDSAFGTSHLILTVDQNKIQEDEKILREKANELVSPTKE